MPKKRHNGGSKGPRKSRKFTSGYGNHQRDMSVGAFDQACNLPPEARLLTPKVEPRLERSIFAFYERPELAEVFQKLLSLHVRRYSALTPRLLPKLDLEWRGVDLPTLETICKEERCEDVETLVQCHFLEIYKLGAGDLVVAIGEQAQKVLRELKRRAHDRPDGGARFYTMAEALKEAVIPVAPDSEAAMSLYFSKIVERLYTL